MTSGPLYRKIADDLRAKIEAGELAPGSQLPTEIELMEKHATSRNTVRDAVKLLVIRGLIETRAGQGTFVVETINPFVTNLTVRPHEGDDGYVYTAEVQEAGRKPEVGKPSVEIRQAGAVEAAELQIEEGTPVVIRHQQRRIDGTPMSLQTSFYPMDLVHKGARRLIEPAVIEGGAVVYLAGHLGIRQAGYEDRIRVRAPSQLEIAFFRLPLDGRTPVFEVFRVGFDEEERRFRLMVTVYPTDRNQLRVVVGDVPSTAG
jgi:GntR family transcriptional regulator